ncbi:response regulator transcription factor [Thiomonas sp. FB-6]|uniref:response regulator transcription factor n=1 Tax=Thiomonas sp. FB-6 TaxID=1158291 RepID=UPI0006855307|nr:response regulator [Thiomonas sp. FB-6]
MPEVLAAQAPLGIAMVYLVDDEAVVRDALAWLLRSRRLLCEAHADAGSFQVMLDAALAQDPAWPRAPSCLLLDIRMPGTSGLALFEELARRGLCQVLPVIFLTGHGDVPTAVAALKRGAFDFVEKPFSNNGLVDRIELALRASEAVIRARQHHDALQHRLRELTERERQILDLIARGESNKEIARELDISVRTVEVHRSRVFDKMGVRSAVELANRMRELGAGPQGLPP